MGGAAPPMGGVGALGFAPGHYGALASSSSPSPVVAVAAAGRGGLLPRLPLDPPVGERASIGAVGGGAPGGGAGMCAAAAAGVGFGCGAGGGASTGFVTWSAAQQPPWEHEAALPRPAADIFAQVGGDFQTPEWAAARGPAQWASPPLTVAADDAVGGGDAAVLGQRGGSHRHLQPVLQSGDGGCGRRDRDNLDHEEDGPIRAGCQLARGCRRLHDQVYSLSFFLYLCLPRFPCHTRF